MPEQGEQNEISQHGASDDCDEDPSVVGHDAQHEHVSQSHLEHVQRRLDQVELQTVSGAGAGSGLSD